MNADRRRTWALTAIGAMLVLLTGVGLWRQHLYDTDGFGILALVQGALYLAAVALTWRGGLSRRALIAVLSVAALMRLAVLLAPPYLSDDSMGLTRVWVTRKVHRVKTLIAQGLNVEGSNPRGLIVTANSVAKAILYVSCCASVRENCPQ
jgi:hypothetical protein